MKQKTGRKMFLGIDISRWGQAITIFLAIAAILIAVGSAKYQIQDTSAGVQELNEKYEQLGNRIDSADNSRMQNQMNDALKDQELELILEQKVLPTLDRIEKSIEKLDYKLDRHIINEDLTKK